MAVSWFSKLARGFPNGSSIIMSVSGPAYLVPGRLPEPGGLEPGRHARHSQHGARNWQDAGGHHQDTSATAAGGGGGRGHGGRRGG